jgi:ArsR family metal-binding transcriptional regulator
MLIESYDLEIQASKHSAEEFEYEAIAHLPVDIREVLPYLNAVLRNGIFHPDHPAFSWRKDGLEIAVWPNRIAVEPFETRESAKEMIEELVILVNETWEKRAEIEPDTTRRENLQPLELYRLLPKTNCKACGESTCFNFALKLAAGQVKLEQCGPVCSEDAYAEQLSQLQFLLKTKRTLL